MDEWANAPLTRWGENLGAPQKLLSPNVEPAPDLSRSVEMASPSILANPTLESNNFLGESHPHGTAQIRPGKIREQNRILGAPRFSPHRARGAFAAAPPTAALPLVSRSASAAQ